jgi:hypothetical protein
VGERGLPAKRVRVVLGYLAAGLNPNRAARAAGVSKTFAYELDRKVSGASRLAVMQEAAGRCVATGRRARRGRPLPRERVRLVLERQSGGCHGSADSSPQLYRFRRVRLRSHGDALSAGPHCSTIPAKRRARRQLPVSRARMIGVIHAASNLHSEVSWDLVRPMRLPRGTCGADCRRSRGG